MIFGKYQTKQKNPAFCRKAILNRPDYWILTLLNTMDYSLGKADSLHRESWSLL